MEQQYASRLLPFLKAIRFYHGHDTIGMGHIPQEGPALLVENHSLATYDMALLSAAIYEETGRMTRPLADNLFFKIPYLSKAVNVLGGVRGTEENARSLLEEGELVSVAPGGMKEALRSSKDKYRLMWESRKGFIKLAVETQVPIILAMCPRADDIYQVYDNPVTPWAYQQFKVPVFCVRGVGPTLIPRKVKLTHYLSKPIYPPALSGKRSLKALVESFHKRIMNHSNKLMLKALDA